MLFCLLCVCAVSKDCVSLCEVQAKFGVSMPVRVCVCECVSCWGMGGKTENVCVCSPWEGVGESVVWWGLPGWGQGGAHLGPGTG